MMTNLFDYLIWRGDLPLACNALNEIDGMILARFSYMPFENIMKPNSETAVSIAECAESMLSLPGIEDQVLLKEDTRLLTALARSERFRNMEIFGYVNQIEMETQTQFSAITIRLCDQAYYISFRGTDNTLVGWKEDFNMSFVCPVPAQELSVQYIEKKARQVNGSIFVGGHSKGGNLAVYAAAFCSRDIQSRIEAVYNYDGPGFDDQVLLAEGYQRICGRVSTFVPQSSIVGMLLGHEEKYSIVHSTQMGGIWQHDTYSWEVQRDGFVCLETVNNSSRFIDYTLKAWVSDLDCTQRERFIDTMYTVMAETNASTVKELSEHWFVSAKKVLKSVKNLDEETRKAVTQALLSLVKSAKTGLSQVIQSRNVR